MKTLKSFAAGAVFASALLAAACGQTTGDRAVSGGLLGAAGGAAIGSLTGSAGTGAVIGGVAGAAAGALTRPSQVQLGDPVWRQNHHCVRFDSNNNCLEWAPNS